MPQRSKPQTDEVSVDVDGFVRRALSILAHEMRMSGEAKSRVLELFVTQLYDAVTCADRQALPRAMDGMLASGLDAYQIADHYIPAVAQQLGEAWCSDQMDFAKVTIGSARLQGALRSLGPEWCAEDSYIAPNAPRCLVIVPQDAQHTLGATILTGQLRRAGISVSLELGRSVGELARLSERVSFDAVMISASTRESLEGIRQIVQKVRPTGRHVPVIVGGNILAQENDIAHLTGADLATSEMDEAITFCGFNARMLRVITE